MSGLPITPEKPAPQPPTEEPSSTLESPERIASTKKALENLVDSASSYALPFRRKIEERESEPDSSSPRGVYERWVTVDTGKGNLKTIELRTPAGEGLEYVMSLTFDPENPTGELMLSSEPPAPAGLWTGANEHGAGSLTAGIKIEGRRIQDFLYNGEAVLPVRERDFSHSPDLNNYRPMGSERKYNATEKQMDKILGILSGAYIKGGNNPKTADLAPELKNLVPTISPAAGTGSV
jgi:hypothetical protein